LPTKGQPTTDEKQENVSEKAGMKQNVLSPGQKAGQMGVQRYQKGKAKYERILLSLETGTRR
jgi:uncharacterized protein YaaN involved in tellurite resistance